LEEIKLPPPALHHSKKRMSSSDSFRSSHTIKFQFTKDEWSKGTKKCQHFPEKANYGEMCGEGVDEGGGCDREGGMLNASIQAKGICRLNIMHPGPTPEKNESGIIVNGIYVSVELKVRKDGGKWNKPEIFEKNVCNYFMLIDLERKMPRFYSLDLLAAGDYEKLQLDDMKTNVEFELSIRMSDEEQHNSSESVCNGFNADSKKMMESSESSDVVLVCGGKEFKCHRVIICARSEYFRGALLGPLTKEKEEGKIDIPDSTPEAVEKIIYFMYTGMIPDLSNFDEALDVLNLADLLLLQNLKETCGMTLAANMTADKFLSTYVCFDKLFQIQGNKTVNKRIQKKMMNFFNRNTIRILEGPEWEEGCKKPEIKQLILHSRTHEDRCERHKHEIGHECEFEYEEEYLINHD